MPTEYFKRTQETKEQLNKHTVMLDRLGFCTADRSAEKRKMHDLFCNRSGIWIECKTDHSCHTHRLMIELKVNLPKEHFKRFFPYETPLNPRHFLPLADAIPATFDGLARDETNLEPKHLLSYYLTQSRQHYLLSIRQLRQVIAEHADEIELICVGQDRDWRNVCLLVPVELVEPIALFRQLQQRRQKETRRGERGGRRSGTPAGTGSVA